MGPYVLSNGPRSLRYHVIIVSQSHISCPRCVLARTPALQTPIILSKNPASRRACCAAVTLLSRSPMSVSPVARVYVIRRGLHVVALLPHWDVVAHSALLLHCQDGSYAVVEYTKTADKRGDAFAFPVALQLLKEDKAKGYQHVRLTGGTPSQSWEWTKQYEGKAVAAGWTVASVAQKMRDVMRGQYGVADNNCHDAQEKIRKLLEAAPGA